MGSSATAHRVQRLAVVRRVLLQPRLLQPPDQRRERDLALEPRQRRAVWFDMLAGDSRQLLDTRVLADPRVTYYWDEGKVAAAGSPST
jgi:hypothetical protein